MQWGEQARSVNALVYSQLQPGFGGVAGGGGAGARQPSQSHDEHDGPHCPELPQPQLHASLTLDASLTLGAGVGSLTLGAGEGATCSSSAEAATASAASTARWRRMSIGCVGQLSGALSVGRLA